MGHLFDQPGLVFVAFASGDGVCQFNLFGMSSSSTSQEGCNPLLSGNALSESIYLTLLLFPLSHAEDFERCLDKPLSARSLSRLLYESTLYERFIIMIAGFKPIPPVWMMGRRTG